MLISVLLTKDSLRISSVRLFRESLTSHVGKAFNGFGKAFDRAVDVAVLDSVANTVVDVSFEHNLAAAMQRRFGGVDLHEDILAGNVLIDHAVNSLNLSDDFFEPAVKIFRIHALTH